MLHRITSAALLEVLHPRGLTDKEALVLNAIISGRGQPVQRRELVDAVYGDCEDGGPMDPLECIRIYVYRLRAKGYDIEARYGWGYSLAPAEPKRKRAV